MLIISLLLIVFTTLDNVNASMLCERWQHPYQGNDITGEYVVGFWDFSGEHSDDTGGKFKLAGAQLAVDQRFGTVLESFCGYPVVDKKHAAIVANHPSLTPVSSFTLEMWLKPKEEMQGYDSAYLVDKKYVSHTDYQLILEKEDSSGKRCLRLNLGFGDESESFISYPGLFQINTWTHIAVTYNGRGRVEFFKNGVSIGCVDKPGRGRVAAGKYHLSLGDRIGSYYHGFPGYMTQVRLSNRVLEFRPLGIKFASERYVYLRMEQTQDVAVQIVNQQQHAIQHGKIVFALNNQVLKQMELAQLPSGGSQIVTLPLDTTLRPGRYNVAVQIYLADNSAGAVKTVFADSIDFVLVPRQPQQMPVIMWGLGGEHTQQEFARLAEIGFTHCFGFRADYPLIFAAGKPVASDKPERIDTTRKLLDAALEHNMRLLSPLSPGHWAAIKPELRRITRTGKELGKTPQLCANSPALGSFFYNVGASVAQTYGNFPAWESALLHTEIRDGANVCWHEHDKKAYQEATGEEYPDQVVTKWGIPYQKIPDFPQDRVVPDNYPLLRFLQWYWKAGDGWNQANTELHRGLKSTGRKDLWTFHDPAVRVASVYGSGGDVDVISNWTYSYPDPVRIGVATDELLAMAAGASRRQDVMKMTQVIWYRSRTAPERSSTTTNDLAASPWEDADSDAAYITIAPMHLREAFWCKIARPIKGIMYHGWQSLVPTESRSSYRYTHSQTQHELGRLTRRVVKPLGPTLLQVPDRPADIAYLQSFASQMLARRGTFGWGHTWSGDAYQMLMWAHLQAEIVFDETIVERGLDKYRILVMMDCDVLMAAVVDRIKHFQTKGGIIVGDENLCPAIKPDITISSYKRINQGDTDRAVLVAKAAELRQSLDKVYQRYCDSSTPDIIPRCRTFGTTDYIFAVNDKREFGSYVGHHGLVMENGLPVESTLTVARNHGFVYDLVEGAAIKPLFDREKLNLVYQFEPCDGCVLMITKQQIAGLQITVPESVKLGQAVPCSIRVVDAEDNAIDGVIPTHIEILDAEGGVSEWSGYYALVRGCLELQLDIASNDCKGLWQVKVRELASRKVKSSYFRVL